MQNRTIKTLFVLIAGIIVMASCTSKYVTQPYTPPPPPGYQYSLTTDVQPIFDAKCVRCHKAGAVPPDLSSGKAYDDLMSMNMINTESPSSSVLYKKMNDGSMATYCTKQDADVVLQWITQGAKNN
jgi:hypothetical protein